MEKNKLHSQERASRTVEEAAALWVAKASLGTLEESERDALDAWLAADPLHRATFDRFGGALASTDEISDFVIGTHARLQGVARRRRRLGLGATLALGGMAILSASFDLPALLADQRTDRGEVRVVALADGSTLWLDADSAVDIDMGAAERRVTLLRGRIHAEVAHRDAPFVVLAGGGEVRDIGTAFDVAEMPGGARAVVTEGMVEASSGHKHLRLVAGEGARWTGEAAPTPLSPTDVRAGAGWREGRLSFDDRPLSDVIATLSRYSAKRLVLLNDEAAARRVSGVVRINRADQDIISLARSQGLAVTNLGPILLLR